eukprot:m.1637235 g.1637235  ORF g.1637235 m.1637235 type:complete len:643 (-) comp25602_c0_seq1:1228-3156(-)
MDDPAAADSCLQAPNGSQNADSSATCIIEGMIEYKTALSNSFGLVVLSQDSLKIESTNLAVCDVVFKAKDGWAPKNSIAEMIDTLKEGTTVRTCGYIEPLLKQSTGCLHAQYVCVQSSQGMLHWQITQKGAPSICTTSDQDGGDCGAPPSQHTSRPNPQPPCTAPIVLVTAEKHCAQTVPEVCMDLTRASQCHPNKGSEQASNCHPGTDIKKPPRSRKHRGNANRAQKFAEFLIETFGIETLCGPQIQSRGGPAAVGVLDVAGGSGDLAFELSYMYGIPCTTVDPRQPKFSSKQRNQIRTKAAWKQMLLLAPAHSSLCAQLRAEFLSCTPRYQWGQVLCDSDYHRTRRVFFVCLCLWGCECMTIISHADAIVTTHPERPFMIENLPMATAAKMSTIWLHWDPTPSNSTRTAVHFRRNGVIVVCFQRAHIVSRYVSGYAYGFDDKLGPEVDTASHGAQFIGATAATASEPVAVIDSPDQSSPMEKTPTFPDTDGGAESVDEAAASHDTMLQRLVRECTVVVGLHPDQATGAIVDIASTYGKPWAVVPCCVFPRSYPHRRTCGNFAACGDKCPCSDLIETAGPCRSVSTHEDLCLHLLRRQDAHGPREGSPPRASQEMLHFDGRNTVIWSYAKEENRKIPATLL